MQPMFEGRQALGVADLQISAGHEKAGHFLHKPLLGGTIKVNHNITTKDEVEFFFKRIRLVEKIHKMPGHPVPQEELHTGAALLLSDALLEKPPPHLDRQVADPLV